MLTPNGGTQINWIGGSRLACSVLVEGARSGLLRELRWILASLTRGGYEVECRLKSGLMYKIVDRLQEE